MVNRPRRDLHDAAYQDWRDERADEFAGIQHRAFKAGFEAAVKESRQFNELREWLEAERDRAQERHKATGDIDYFARRMAFVDVLTKLAEIGCMDEPLTQGEENGGGEGGE